MKIITFLLLLTSSNIVMADYKDWLAFPNKDNWLGYTAGTLLVVDWAQTLDSIERPGLVEENLILGENPSRSQINVYFTTILLGHYLINTLDATQKYKNYWNISIVAVEIYAINRNYKLGIKAKF